MNESKIKVLDDLIDAFGEKTVLSKERRFRPTTAELRTIYDILNRNLFENKLDTIPATMERESSMVDRLNIYNAVSHGVETKIDGLPRPINGMYLAAVNPVENKDGQLTEVRIFDDIIMLNFNRLGLSIFIFVVACLCHEMIHYCDRFSDEFKAHIFKRTVDSDYKFNSHDDKIFDEKTKLANENGINVVKTGSADIETDNLKSRQILKNVFGENEKFQETTHWQTDDMLYVANKRTGRGFLAIFD